MGGQAVVGALRVDVSAETGGLEEGLSRAETRAKAFGARMQSIGKGMAKAGAIMSVGITLPAIALARQAIPAAKEAAQAFGQVEAAVKSTGGTAKRTAAELSDLAGKLQDTSTFDDDDIMRQGIANLLRFGKVSGEVFDRAAQAAVDYSARTGTDLAGSFNILGKSLNDPVRGVNLLRRAGILFTAEQTNQIKALVKSGDVTRAQGIILDEFGKKFGGAAAQLRANSPDAAMQQQWRTFQEAVGAVLLKVLPKATAVLTGFLEKFNNMSPALQTTIVAVAAGAAAFGPILTALGGLVTLLGTVIPWIVSLGTAITGAAATAGGFGALLAGIAWPLTAIVAAVAAVYLAWKNWDKIAPVLQGVWQSIWSTIGPPLMDLFAAVKEAATAFWQSAFVAEVGKTLRVLGTFSLFVAKVLGATLPGIFRALGAAVVAVFEIIGGVIRVITRLLSGDFAGAWEAAKGIVYSFAKGVGGILGNLTQAAIAAVKMLAEGVGRWLGEKLTAVWENVKEKIKAVGDAFKWLWDVVVGHSYIPDMVDEIAAQMDRLDGEMVAPTKAATKGASDAFKKMADANQAAAMRHFKALKQVRDDIAALLDNLFPEAAAWREFQKNLKLLDEAERMGVLSRDAAAEARDRLRKGDLDGESTLRDGRVSDSITEAENPWSEGGIMAGFDPKELLDSLPDVSDALKKTAGTWVTKTKAMLESWQDMANGVVDSVRGMVDAFKRGDFLSVVIGVLNTVQLALDAIQKIGAAYSASKGGGGGVQKSSSSGGTGAPKGFATGGGFTVGGIAGVDKNLVQFRATRGEEVEVHQNGRGRARGGDRYYFSGNLMTPEFWAQIQAQTDGAAARGAHGGRQLAHKDGRKAAKRRLA